MTKRGNGQVNTGALGEAVGHSDIGDSLVIGNWELVIGKFLSMMRRELTTIPKEED